jgi:hypothetical protein
LVMIARLNSSDFCFGLDGEFSGAIRERLAAIHRLTVELSADPHRAADLDAVGQAKLLVALDEIASTLKAECDRLHLAYWRCCL